MSVKLERDAASESLHSFGKKIPRWYHKGVADIPFHHRTCVKYRTAFTLNMEDVRFRLLALR
jgi:hypothetical protein